MANKVDTLMDAVETKLAELVSADGTGVLKAVERRVINALTEPRVPILGLVPSDATRRGGQGATAAWEVAVLVMLCTRAKDVACDESITEIMAEIMGKLDALNASDSPGGSIDMPGWHFWYRIGDSEVPVGAWGTLRLGVTGTLKTA
jgi:hypothetical protein